MSFQKAHLVPISESYWNVYVFVHYNDYFKAKVEFIKSFGWRNIFWQNDNSGPIKLRLLKSHPIKYSEDQYMDEM